MDDLRHATIHCLSLNPALDVAGAADTVEPTHKIRVSNQCTYPGGGAINVARVAQMLDSDVLLSYIAGGSSGHELRERVAAMPFPSHCIESDSPTRITFTIHERSTAQEFRFVPAGEPVSATTLAAIVKRADTVSQEFMVLSGSLPVNAPIDTYANIAAAVAKNDTKVVLDCSGDALQSVLDKTSVYLFKPSFGELEQLAGKKLDESAAMTFAQSLADNDTAEIIAVSMGQHGAFVCTKNTLLRAPALRVDMRSAVGAGDSFVAGMIARLSKSKSLKDAFTFGIAAGAAAVMTEGTELCRLQDMQALIPQVVVSELRSN